MSSSEWQDERLPEEVLSNSAIKTPYSNPWEMLSRPEDGNLVGLGPSSFSHQRRIHDKWFYKCSQFKKFVSIRCLKMYHHWINLYVGFQEKQRRLKGLPPSPRAFQEGLKYYAGLYQSKAPNAQIFLDFLQRNGVPDWANPYSESSIEHYQYHPLGFLAADVDYLLQALEQEWEKEEKEKTVPSLNPTLESLAETLDAFPNVFPPSAQLDTEKKWPSLYDSQVENAKELEKIQLYWRSEARLCWALMLVFAKNQEQEFKKKNKDKKSSIFSSSFSYLKKEVHPDNLWLITVDAYQHFPDSFQGFSKAMVKEAAQKLGFGLGLELTSSSDDAMNNDPVNHGEVDSGTEENV